MRGLALAAAGEEAAVVDCLAEAPAFACPQGYVRVFTDEGAPMGALLACWSRPRRKTRPLPVACRSAAWPGSCKRSANNLT